MAKNLPYGNLFKRLSIKAIVAPKEESQWECYPSPPPAPSENVSRHKHMNDTWVERIISRVLVAAGREI